MAKKIVLLFSIIVLLAGCEKAFLPKEPEQDAEAIFNQIWNDFKEHYALFEVKNVDWDAMYNKYHPLNEKDMHPVLLFDIIASMLNELKDGHVNLVAPFDRQRYTGWYLNYPPNFNRNLLERNYWKNHYRITRGGAFYYMKFDSVGYIYIPSFSAGGFGYIDGVLSAMDDLKGIIIDVRNNGGGDPKNAETVASRFASQKTLYAYWKWKNGPGKNDFTEPQPFYLNPEGHYYPKKVVVLTNRSSYSATNDFVMMMKVLDNVTVIGDSTGGGEGSPFFRELQNGWYYRFSRTQTLDVQMNHVESGIAPDIKIDMDSTDEMNGIDTILEYALSTF
jgi:hypothetical protein